MSTTELTTVSNNMEQIGVVETALQELEKQNVVVYDFATKEGYDEAKITVKPLVTMRNKVDKFRKAENTRINGLGADIQKRIAALETPLQKGIKEYENKEAEAERKKVEAENERIASHENIVKSIKSCALSVSDIADIDMKIELLREEEKRDFEEFSDIAREAIAEAYADLRTKREMIMFRAEKEAQVETGTNNTFDASTTARDFAENATSDDVEDFSGFKKPANNTGSSTAQSASNNIASLSRDRLNELEKAEETLNALMAAGVENWDGYSAAMELVG